MRRALVIVLVALAVVTGATVVWWFSRSIAGSAAAPAVSETAADRMDSKLAGIVQNGKQPKPQPLITELSEDEVNSYFRYRLGAKTPVGVSDINFNIHRDQVLGRCIVDFDKVKAASRSRVNPLVDAMLAGRKPVSATGHFTSANGSGTFHLEQVTVGTVTLDGFLLDAVIKHFVVPRYPRVAIDEPFELPSNIDRIVLAEKKALVYQK